MLSRTLSFGRPSDSIHFFHSDKLRILTVDFSPALMQLEQDFVSNRPIAFVLPSFFLDMILKNGVQTFHAKSRAEWREWLSHHHQSEQSVWLIIYKKDCDIPSVYYPEAVDEALCFGWIDSKPNKRDTQSYFQFFSKRNPKSNWSQVNKEKVAKLLDQGLMAPAGLEMIEIAKQSGTWTALDEVENMTIPADLRALFDQNATAWKNWESFPRSAKRGILEWILNAKRPETRRKRIEETVTLASDNIRANQYRP